MIISNNNKYVLKCYLKFFEIVADEMQSFKALATAINDF